MPVKCVTCKAQAATHELMGRSICHACLEKLSEQVSEKALEIRLAELARESEQLIAGIDPRNEAFINQLLLERYGRKK